MKTAPLIIGSVAGTVALVWAGDESREHSPRPDVARPIVKNQGYLPLADAPINYRAMELSDPVARRISGPPHGQILFQPWARAKQQEFLK